MQIAAVRGKIGNPGAGCKFGRVDKRVIDKQELPAGELVVEEEVAQWHGCSLERG